MGPDLTMERLLKTAGTVTQDPTYCVSFACKKHGENEQLEYK